MKAMLRKGFRDNRVMMISLALANLGIAWVVLAIYPLFETTLEETSTSGLEGLLGEGESFASPVGYLNSQLFAFMPLVFIALAIVAGTGALVGEETNGTMDLLLSTPVNRRSIVLGRALALLSWLVLVCLAAYPGLLVASAPIDFDMSPWTMFVGTAAMIPPTLVFAGLTIYAAAAAETRAGASALVVAVLVVTYLGNVFGATSDALRWMRWPSPFYWGDATRAMTGDTAFALAGAALLLALTAAFVAGAVLAYQRKDIASGAREWHWLGWWRGRAQTRGSAEPA